MTDSGRAAALTEADLEGALRDLAGAIAVPGLADGATADGLGRDDPARLARLRIERGETAAPWWAQLTRHGTPRPGRRRLARGTAVALVFLVALAAVAGAIGLGLPGIRIVQAPGGSPPPGSASAATPSRSPTPTPTGSLTAPSVRPTATVSLPLGRELGLGDPIALAEAGPAAGIDVLLPSASGVGSPAAVWVLDHRVSLVWPAGPTLPATRETGVGLILSEFRGSVNSGYFEKIVGPDTTVDPVQVDGTTGYWISGAPHEIVFIDADGLPVFDSRRIVGDTLIWTRGDATYRLETALDRVAAVALAETLR